MEYDIILNEITKYSEMNKLAFFVGAGISKLSGFPTWKELIIQMGNCLNYNFTKSYDVKGNFNIILSQDEFLKIPQLYYAQFGKSKYLEIVKNNFNKVCNPNEIHDLIMSLHPNHIMTTNYDTLIEDAATKFGENYSVIASDKDISSAETIRYLIKLHGDFTTEFVLKESDYLNYEFNYQLVCNLMKSIFSSNLVVFIGYSLNDYNIKLVLNWMQNVQKNEYIKPIFINTDDKKSDVENKYYLDSGIRVLDCNDLLTSHVDYFNKYKSVLTLISNFSPAPKLNDKEGILKYLFDKVSGIENLEFIKRCDFKLLFSPDFEIDDNWEIKHLTHVSNTDNFWQDYIENKNFYKNIDASKCKQIDLFAKSCNLKTELPSSKVFSSPCVKIKNESFINDFDKLINYCTVDYKKIKEQYKKAYFLCKIGRLSESYTMFTDVLKKSKQSKNWEIFYLSQINRYHLYKKIQYARTYLQQPFTHFSLGRLINIIDDESYSKMEIEMSSCDINSQFNKLPYYFKKKHYYLSKYSKPNCYSDEIVDLMKIKDEIEKTLLFKENIYLGLSEFDKIKLDMLEAVKFTEDNMICVQEYEESKNYIKNALFIWLCAYYRELNKKNTDFSYKICNIRLKFELQDIILLSKCCKTDDLSYIKKRISFKAFPFEQVNELQKYVLNLTNFYTRKFDNEFLSTEYLWWQNLNLEIQILLDISSNYINSKKNTLKIITFILNHNNINWSLTDRTIVIRKFVTKKNLLQTLSILENYFINKLKLFYDTNDLEHNDIVVISKLISELASKCKYDFKALSDFVISYKQIKTITFALMPISLFLSIDVKNLIINNYEIKSINDLEEIVKVDNTIQLRKYLYIIENTLEKYKIDTTTPGYFTLPSSDYYIKQICIFIIKNEINFNKLSNFFGYWHEYDFLFNIFEFKQENFNVEWLLYYDEKVINYIKKDEAKNLIVKKALMSMDNFMCKNHAKRWLYLTRCFF